MWDMNRSKCPLKRCEETTLHSVLLLADEAASSADNQQNCRLGGKPKSTFIISVGRNRIATLHGDHSIRIIDTSTGVCLQTLDGHVRSPWTAEFHPSHNAVLASGDLEGCVRIWDLQSGDSDSWQCPEGSITSLTFHPMEKRLLIASSCSIYLWSWESNDEPVIYATTSYSYEKIRWLKFDRFGDFFYTGITQMSVGWSILRQEPSASELEQHHQDTVSARRQLNVSLRRLPGVSTLRQSSMLASVAGASNGRTVDRPDVYNAATTLAQLHQVHSHIANGVSNPYDDEEEDNSFTVSSRILTGSPQVPTPASGSIVQAPTRTINLWRRADAVLTRIDNYSSNNNSTELSAESLLQRLEHLTTNPDNILSEGNIRSCLILSGRLLSQLVVTINLALRRSESSLPVSQHQRVRFSILMRRLDSISSSPISHTPVIGMSFTGAERNARPLQQSRREILIGSRTRRSRPGVTWARSNNSPAAASADIIHGGASSQQLNYSLRGVEAVQSMRRGLIDYSLNRMSAADMLEKTQRIQRWELVDHQINLSDNDENIVTRNCKIHNDASIDISEDGLKLVTLVPQEQDSTSLRLRGFPVPTIAGTLVHIISLAKENMGEILHSHLMYGTPVSVSLSPSGNYLLSGLVNRYNHGQSKLMYDIHRLQPGNRDLVRCRSIAQSNEPEPMSVNVVKWAPHPGQGFYIGTNKGTVQFMLSHGFS